MPYPDTRFFVYSDAYSLIIDIEKSHKRLHSIAFTAEYTFSSRMFLYQFVPLQLNR